nr:MAG TPA: hypothetical protein [Caudoviricetes sp.]
MKSGILHVVIKVALSKMRLSPNQSGYPSLKSM